MKVPLVIGSIAISFIAAVTLIATTYDDSNY